MLGRFNASDFGASAAAADVVALVQHVQATVLAHGGADVVLYGVSYGSFWVQRIMQLFPATATRWIIDSVIVQPWQPEGGWQHMALHGSRRIDAFLDACAAHATCGQYLSPARLAAFRAQTMAAAPAARDATASHFAGIFNEPALYKDGFMQAVYAAVDAVAGAPSTSSVRRSSDGPEALAPPSRRMLGRPERTASDVACDMNMVVHRLAVANELYGTDLEARDFVHAYAGLTFDTGTSDLLATLPWASTNPPSAAWVTTPIAPADPGQPVLVLASELDVQSDVTQARNFSAALVAAGSTVEHLEAVYCPHGVIQHASPQDSFCGVTVLSRFILGQVPTDVTGCLRESVYPDFDTASYANVPPVNASDTEPTGTAEPTTAVPTPPTSSGVPAAAAAAAAGAASVLALLAAALTVPSLYCM